MNAMVVLSTGNEVTIIFLAKKIIVPFITTPKKMTVVFATIVLSHQRQ
jgi:hypothetical protein